MKKKIVVKDHRYSDTIYNKKILICGPPYPLPYGGISVHLQSVHTKFQRQGNYVYQHNTLVAYRFRWFSWYLLKLAWRVLWIRPDIVYYHTLSLATSVGELQLLVWLKRLIKYQIVTVDHDCLHLLKRSNRFKKRLNRMIPLLDHQILIGSSTYDSYCDAGIACARSVSVERAFVPLTHLDVHLLSSSRVPTGFEQFRATHAPLLTLACTRLAFLDGRDLYGIDMSIEVLKRIQTAFPSVGLVCLIGSIDELAYYTLLQARLVDYNVQDAVLMITQPHRLWPVLEKTDLFLRPTLCDGASISEDEAHYIGIPVVASDVCPRHSKTITYVNGSVDDCSLTVNRVLNGIRQKRA